MSEAGSYEHYSSSIKDHVLLRVLRDYLNLHQHDLIIYLHTQSQSIRSCVKGGNGH